MSEGAKPLTSILDVLMRCVDCGAVSKVRDCEVDPDGDSSLICPVPDCGGIMCELRNPEHRGD